MYKEILVLLDGSELVEVVLPYVDLIAMSTHCRTGLGRLVYGSVAEKVLQSATCPVPLIRAKGEG